LRNINSSNQSEKKSLQEEGEVLQEGREEIRRKDKGNVTS